MYNIKKFHNSCITLEQATSCDNLKFKIYVENGTQDKLVHILLDVLSRHSRIMYCLTYRHDLQLTNNLLLKFQFVQEDTTVSIPNMSCK